MIKFKDNDCKSKNLAKGYDFFKEMMKEKEEKKIRIKLLHVEKKSQQVVIRLEGQNFTSDSPGKLHVSGGNGASLGVDAAHVGVFEESNDVGFHGFLDGGKGTG